MFGFSKKIEKKLKNQFDNANYSDYILLVHQEHSVVELVF